MSLLVAMGSTYTITANPDAIYSVEVSYLDGFNAGLPPAEQTRTPVTAATSPIKFSQDPIDVPENQGYRFICNAIGNGG